MFQPNKWDLTEKLQWCVMYKRSVHSNFQGLWKVDLRVCLLKEAKNKRLGRRRSDVVWKATLWFSKFHLRTKQKIKQIHVLRACLYHTYAHTRTHLHSLPLPLSSSSPGLWFPAVTVAFVSMVTKNTQTEIQTVFRKKQTVVTNQLRTLAHTFSVLHESVHSNLR